MIFSPSQTLADHLIIALSKEPRLTLEQLQKQIAPELKQPVSLQSWYKTIKKLIAAGVIIKNKKDYSLNTSWVGDILAWSAQLEATYITKEQSKVIALPQKEGAKIKYSFPDLLTLNSFWAHLLVHIAAQFEKTTVYAYNPHFWFYLAHSDVEKQYNRSMRLFNAPSYIIIGSNSFLDEWNARFFDPKLITSWLSPKPLYPAKNIYLNYIAGYLIEVKIDADQAEKLDYFFKKTESLANLSPVEIISLFQQKAPCTLTIAKNKQKGEAFKRKILRHF